MSEVEVYTGLGLGVCVFVSVCPVLGQSKLLHLKKDQLWIN